MGAWIETFQTGINNAVNQSHPTWVRGLKQNSYDTIDEDVESHPTWVRGLKPIRERVSERN